MSIPTHVCDRRRLLRAWVGFALPLALAACAATPARFYHQSHRQKYAIQDAELTRMQFYVSTRVVAHDLDAEGAQAVLVVEQGTPGVVVASGPNWIRVRFQAGGEGVVFLATPNGSESSYVLATEAEDGSGYRPVLSEPDRILRVGGRRYRIVAGSGAVLLVNAADLTNLIQTGRSHVQGQRRPE
jgi:hypothetical protein